MPVFGKLKVSEDGRLKVSATGKLKISTVAFPTVALFDIVVFADSDFKQKNKPFYTSDDDMGTEIGKITIPPRLVIDDFGGVFTNADSEDIPDKCCVELQNLRPIHGKLVNTDGIGVKINSATAVALQNFYTFTNENITSDGLTGEVYIGVYSGAGFLVTLYGWGVTAGAWTALNNLTNFSFTGSYYHRNAKNPILQEDNILRILPGGLGKFTYESAEYEPKGIWVGYIDRDFFDGHYLPAVLFYDYATNIDPPSFTFSVALDTNGANGYATAITEHYKFSYIYDGVQESLLSDVYTVPITQYTIPVISFAIVEGSHNNRITAMKVYRCDTPEGVYKHIHTIDFLRKDILNDGTGDAHNGYRNAYVPGLSTYTFVNTMTYRLTIDSVVQVITNKEGTALTGQNNVIFRTASAETAPHWDKAWNLDYDPAGGTTWESTGQSGASGGYLGDKLIFVSSNLGHENYAGGIIRFTSGYYVISQNSNRAVLIDAFMGGVDRYKDWAVMGTNEGLYYTVESPAGTHNYAFADAVLTDGDEHPLQNFYGNEVSIAINGQYAKVIGGRLWQGDIVIDPGGTNEKHRDWASYSELHQYDVNPASNVRRIADREGGAMTGIAEIFGNPVILKRQTIVRIITSNSPDDPSAWYESESSHNIGNIAVNGYIDVMGTLYVCYFDGIYALAPNNLAPTDQTPTERLKITDAIEDKYLALSQANKEAIKSGYDPIRSEIIFTLGSEVWAYHIVTGNWREIVSARTINIMTPDENGQIMVYQSSDKKIYSLGETESVDIKYKSKTIALSDDVDEPVRHIIVNYLSTVELTMKVYEEGNIASGSIEKGVTYTVNEDPYVNGSTFTVTYNAVGYTHGQTFTGLWGRKTYTTSGTGRVEIINETTLPISSYMRPYKVGIRYRCKNFVIEITS